ncbi:DUF1748-domain-containing protein [Mrakia frigida]|uniref:mitofissin n=1 Tax=Mrakia frigida TaxID=29902 RepID=UPI003FCBEF62
MFSTLIRLAVDALLVSAFLAGLKRSTGLTPAISKIGNKDVRVALTWYLEIGEYSFDFAQVFLGRSAFFVREFTGTAR